MHVSSLRLCKPLYLSLSLYFSAMSLIPFPQSDRAYLQQHVETRIQLIHGQHVRKQRHEPRHCVLLGREADRVQVRGELRVVKGQQRAERGEVEIEARSVVGREKTAQIPRRDGLQRRNGQK
jgi:hypothetical protein